MTSEDLRHLLNDPNEPGDDEDPPEGEEGGGMQEDPGSPNPEPDPHIKPT